MRDQTEPLEEAVRTLDPAKFNSRREYLAVKLAAHLADRPFRASDALIDELRTEFSESEIAEMVFCCGMFSWGNIVGIGLRVDLQDHTHYGPLDWERAAADKRRLTIADAKSILDQDLTTGPEAD